MSLLEHGNRYRTQESEYNSLLKWFIGGFVLYVTVFGIFVLIMPLVMLPAAAVFGASFGVARLMGASVERSFDIANFLYLFLSFPYAIWALFRILVPLLGVAFKTTAPIFKGRFPYTNAWPLIRAVFSNAGSDWVRLKHVFTR